MARRLSISVRHGRFRPITSWWIILGDRRSMFLPNKRDLIDHDVTDAADLYSAGLVLFRCLAGKSPFQGDTVGTILFEQMTSPVPELRQLGISVPRAFDELLQRLLRKDPRDRYQSADAVLADLEAIADGGSQRAARIRPS